MPTRFFAALLVLWALQAAKGFLLPFRSEAHFWAVDLTYFVVIPLVALPILARLSGRPVRELLSLRLPGKVASWWAVTGYTLLMIVAYFAMLYVVRELAVAYPAAFAGVPSQINYGTIAAGLGPWKMAAVLYFALTASLVEEYLYRGFMGRYFLERPVPRPAIYVLVSSILFATFHWHVGLATVLLALGMGVVAALIVSRTRTLAPVLIAHFVVDVISFAA